MTNLLRSRTIVWNVIYDFFKLIFATILDSEVIVSIFVVFFRCFAICTLSLYNVISLTIIADCILSRFFMFNVGQFSVWYKTFCLIVIQYWAWLSGLELA